MNRRSASRSEQEIAVWYFVRFFRTVPPVPRLVRAGFMTAVLIGAVRIIADRTDGNAALLPIVVLQVFATSTGYAGPARRGYYDLLLVRGDGRLRIACAQWLAAASPGLAAWGGLSIVELAAGAAGHGSGSVITTGSLAAMVVVSTVPWAITVHLPRFTGAVTWLLVFVFAITVRPLGPFASGSIPSGLDASGLRAFWALLFPPLLIGLDPREVLQVGWLALAASAISMATALTWIVRADVPLEAAQ